MTYIYHLDYLYPKYVVNILKIVSHSHSEKRSLANFFLKTSRPMTILFGSLWPRTNTLQIMQLNQHSSALVVKIFRHFSREASPTRSKQEGPVPQVYFYSQSD